MGLDDDTFRDEFEQRLPATTRSLAELRHAVREWAARATDDEDRMADIVLAASEMGAAAMRVAPPTATVVLAAWVDRACVVIESRVETSRDAHAPHANDDDGDERGFSIVAALSDVIAVRDSSSGVVVRARLRRRGFDVAVAG
ncbi:MAG: hypothetical protein JWL83_4393 [Actinomycetia bacterium]|nr:hypothetical protein [Actinomycetes bacterium]